MAWLQHGGDHCLSLMFFCGVSSPQQTGTGLPLPHQGTGDNCKSKYKGFDDASSLSPYPKFSWCSPGWQHARWHRNPESTCRHTPLVPEGLLRSKPSPLARHVPCPCFSTTSSRPGLRSNYDAAETSVTVPWKAVPLLASGHEHECPGALRGFHAAPLNTLWRVLARSRRWGFRYPPLGSSPEGGGACSLLPAAARLAWLARPLAPQLPRTLPGLATGPLCPSWPVSQGTGINCA